MENSIFAILFAILAIVLILIFLGLVGVEDVGPIHIGESNLSIRSRCLEKGYQDFRINKGKVYCIQKEEFLILE